MELPCITCKFKTVRKEGHRAFFRCIDKEKEKKNFHEDTFWYQHTCDAYEPEAIIKEAKGEGE
jgi:hypothetical protein